MSVSGAGVLCLYTPSKKIFLSAKQEEKNKGQPVSDGQIKSRFTVKRCSTLKSRQIFMSPSVAAAILLKLNLREAQIEPTYL